MTPETQALLAEADRLAASRIRIVTDGPTAEAARDYVVDLEHCRDALAAALHAAESRATTAEQDAAVADLYFQQMADKAVAAEVALAAERALGDRLAFGLGPLAAGRSSLTMQETDDARFAWLAHRAARAALATEVQS